MLEVIFMLAVTMASTLGRDLLVDDDVLVVNVERFGGNLPDCEPRQVCADVFNFTRDHGDGTGRRESRFIENCRCRTGAPCGRTGSQLMFKETKTQSMVTCEEAEDFLICEQGQIAKEQHNTPDGVFYQINCVCPNNEFPSNFYNKMTAPKKFYEMSPDEQAVYKANRRSRYFRCREPNEYRPNKKLFRFN